MTTDIAKAGEVAPVERKSPELDPAMIQLDSEGFVFRRLVVRLPPSFTLQDLGNPGIWKAVQLSRTAALRRLDRLSIFAYDESWLAECIVSGATMYVVTLSKPVVTQLPPRTATLPRCDDYAVEWRGNGYGIVRLRDGNKHAQVFETVAQAEREMWAQHPTKAA